MDCKDNSVNYEELQEKIEGANLNYFSYDNILKTGTENP